MSLFDPNKYHHLVPDALKRFMSEEDIPVVPCYDPINDDFHYDYAYDEGWYFSDDPGYIYIIQDKNKLIKIGKSKDVIKRFESHKTSNPFIRLIAYKFTEHMTQDEKILHSLCNQYKMSGTREWFDIECISVFSELFNLTNLRTPDSAAFIELLLDECDKHNFNIDREDCPYDWDDDQGNWGTYTVEDWDRDFKKREFVYKKIDSLLYDYYKNDPQIEYKMELKKLMEDDEITPDEWNNLKKKYGEIMEKHCVYDAFGAAWALNY